MKQKKITSLSLSMYLLLSLLAFGCASKPKYDQAKLEKYPACYHHNFKIYEDCIKKNEAGKSTTALELENKAYPGQYKQD
jgi:hypothetical protein